MNKELAANSNVSHYRTVRKLGAGADPDSELDGGLEEMMNRKLLFTRAVFVVAVLIGGADVCAAQRVVTGFLNRSLTVGGSCRSTQNPERSDTMRKVEVRY